jgi:hypothetical protein
VITIFSDALLTNCVEIWKVRSVLPDSGGLARIQCPVAATDLIDKPIDGFPNEFTLLLPDGLSNSSYFVTLSLRKKYWI